MMDSLVLKKLLVTFLLATPSFFSPKAEELPSAVTDPSLSLHCQTLVQYRQHKMDYKQSLTQLLLKNTKLQKRTPPHKKSLLQKLEHNRRRLNNQMRLTLLAIKKI